MSLVTQEINELRQLLQSYKDGHIGVDKIRVQLAIYSQIEKRTRNILTACAIAAKAGAKSFGKKTLIGIMGDMNEIDPNKGLYDRTGDRGK